MEMPDFDVPASVPAAPAPAPAPAAPAAAPAAPVAAPAAPAAKVETFPTDPLFAPFSNPAPDPTATPAAPAAPTPAEPAPEPTLTPQEVLQAQQTQLLATIARQLAEQRAPRAPAEPAPAAPQRDPKDVLLEQQLIARVPALGVLIELMGNPQNAAALQTMLEAAPAHAETVKTFYEGYADQTIDTLKAFYAEAYGLEPAAVTADDENMLSDQFQLWAGRPENRKLLERYEAGDIRVVKDFANYFQARFVAPARRQGQAAVAARAASVAALPRGGGSTIPSPQQSAPVVQQSGERDVFGEAWGELNRLRSAG